jgi:hypothetical protein
LGISTLEMDLKGDADLEYIDVWISCELPKRIECLVVRPGVE